MPTRLAAATVLIVLAATAGAPAQEERYAIERTQDGYVRLDTRTGQMSSCSEQAGQLVCRLAVDERDAFQDDLDTLAARLSAVEERLSALEGAPATALPGEEEFEQSLSYMERFFRRFMDIVKEFDRDSPAPDRT
ncbi:hypothetical protein EJC49_07405 [Aquibium carbonis]|uniref:Uncharacterized protein n=1 Tax=Aquibium carbonis TaxID=2495581 RepID=A0A429Z035_9HYPH|nr:hypothetical protein [Aquibium carbonis]RST87086.1 hypothetical protein EJC49_07405 [Aquibium carbonis]